MSEQQSMAGACLKRNPVATRAISTSHRQSGSSGFRIAARPSRAMAIGTAGYTAALCVDAIERWGVRNGPVLVAGAAGGVGSIAIALASARGYSVTASTGRSTTHDYLTSLGATAFVGREELLR